MSLSKEKAAQCTCCKLDPEKGSFQVDAEHYKRSIGRYNTVLKNIGEKELDTDVSGLQKFLDENKIKSEDANLSYFDFLKIKGENIELSRARLRAAGITKPLEEINTDKDCWEVVKTLRPDLYVKFFKEAARLQTLEEEAAEEAQ